MLKTRVIPCLDVKDGRVVDGMLLLEPRGASLDAVRLLRSGRG